MNEGHLRQVANFNLSAERFNASIFWSRTVKAPRPKRSDGTEENWTWDTMILVIWKSCPMYGVLALFEYQRQSVENKLHSSSPYPYGQDRSRVHHLPWLFEVLTRGHVENSLGFQGRIGCRYQENSVVGIVNAVACYHETPLK